MSNTQDDRKKFILSEYLRLSPDGVRAPSLEKLEASGVKKHQIETIWKGNMSCDTKVAGRYRSGAKRYRRLDHEVMQILFIAEQVFVPAIAAVPHLHIPGASSLSPITDEKVKSVHESTVQGNTLFRDAMSMRCSHCLSSGELHCGIRG